MSLTPGTRLGIYEVTAKIGEAGWARCIRPGTPRSTGMWRSRSCLRRSPPTLTDARAINSYNDVKDKT